MRVNSDAEDSIAIVCVATIAIFGLVSNALSFYITRTGSRFRNAFGILCRSFLICNLQAIFSLSTWCILVLILKEPILSSPAFFPARMVGVFVNGPYYGSLFVHFFIAINRFCAFVYATKYNRLWSKSKAVVVGCCCWTFGTFISLAHLYGDCSLIFNKSSNYRFSYSRSLAGIICSNTDASITVVSVMAIGCVDFTTLLKIISYRRAMRRNMISTDNAVKERGILFFRQSCILGLVYITYTILLIIHPFVFTDKWMLFLTSLVAWILVQSLDGLTFLIFNRSLICKMGFCSTKITPAVTLNRLQTITRQ
uniref:G-protein coupled receptors family 1 profile domain-containing protein n=1 Tax=Setaria digitata TaxID=48799 RepID=A0A915Q4N8_9BILA